MKFRACIHKITINIHFKCKYLLLVDFVSGKSFITSGEEMQNANMFLMNEIAMCSSNI